MCTAINEVGKYHLFGRTLDIECTYGERIIITPRNYCLDFLRDAPQSLHSAIIGMGCIRDNRPLYYDGANEWGLAMAGLNFPGNAVYHKPKREARNVTSYELIPWVLSQCKTLSSAVELIRTANITDDAFSSELQKTPLHWIIADKNNAVTVESVTDGIKVYENSMGVLTNNPPFPYHITRICDFMNLSSSSPKNTLTSSLKLSAYSRGMGSIGLPGDFSSSSRFIRSAFAKNHTDKPSSEREAVSRFFHIMDTVCVPCGCIKTDEGRSVYTVYTSCIDTKELTYYFTTYNNRRIRAVKLERKYLNSRKLNAFPLRDEEDVLILQ